MSESSVYSAALAAGLDLAWSEGRAETRLAKVVDLAIELLQANAGLLIVRTESPHRFVIAGSRASSDGAGLVPEDLVDYACEKGESIVSIRPPGALIGGATGSTLVVPINLHARARAALVLHEDGRAARFTIDDGDGIQALAVLAGMLLDELHGLNVAPFERIVGGSDVLVRVIERAELVAVSEKPVLIVGDPGTGKALMARFIQGRSGRCRKPFAVVTMGILSRVDRVAQFVGSVVGGVPGWASPCPSYFETTEGGTLLLDNIDEAPLDVQRRLVRFLDDGTFRPLGASEDSRADVRILASTRHPLPTLLVEGKFLPELAERFGPLVVELPRLREYLSDIPALVSHFLAKLAATERNGSKTLSDDALDQLAAHRWPGNVLELRNVIARAYTGTESSVIEAKDLEIAMRPISWPRPAEQAIDPDDLD